MNKKIAIINDRVYNDRPCNLYEVSIVSSFGDRPYTIVSENEVYGAYITSYIKDASQILSIRERIADAKLDNEKVLALIDPVFAKDGEVLSGITDEHINNYRKLMELSDIITPNLTEACILTGESYDDYKNKYCTIKYDSPDNDKNNVISKKIIETIFPLLEKMRYKKNQISIITGIELYDTILTILDVYDGDHGKRQTTCNYSSKIEKRFGAGDIFDAMFFETATSGYNLVDALSVSTSFINNSLRFSRVNKYPINDGIVFEPILYDNIIAIKKKLSEKSKINSNGEEPERK